MYYVVGGSRNKMFSNIRFHHTKYQPSGGYWNDEMDDPLDIYKLPHASPTL